MVRMKCLFPCSLRCNKKKHLGNMNPRGKKKRTMQLVLVDVHFVIHVSMVFFCEPFSNDKKKVGCISFFSFFFFAKKKKILEEK